MIRFKIHDFPQKIQRESLTHGVDCNYCYWLNITEKEQFLIDKRTIFTEHVCMLYGRRLMHRANVVKHDPYIYPCDECVSDNNKYMKPRKEKFND